MGRFTSPFLCAVTILAGGLLAPTHLQAGQVTIINHSDQTVKVSSIGGRGLVKPQEEKVINFANEETGAEINIWWMKNARQLCQIYTPWDRIILVSGKHTIQCLSKQ